MTTEHESGSRGEREIIEMVPCPNCSSSLMGLPKSFPLFDVQCTRCLFRAQIKTARCPPKSEIFGAGFDILDKSLKAGQLMPPLIAHFHWTDTATGAERREVYLFPFLTKRNIRMRTRSDKGARPGYREFNYINLFDCNVPKMIIYSVPKAANKLCK